MNRREFTVYAGSATCALVAPTPLLAMTQQSPELMTKASGKAERRLMLRSIHTGESGEFNYLVDGQWVKDELQRLFHLLRDHRTGDEHPMDGKLLEQLFILQQRHAKDTPFEVISGYRSPKTNAMLAGRSNGVAKKSLHMQGKAIDVRLPGVALSDLHASARDLKAGGVGRYSSSGFIHLDTGRVRYWGA